METIALFGGSFDPPHIAHEIIVKKALTIQGVDKVVVMPTFLNPFKQISHALPALRLKWLKQIFASNPKIEVSSFEIDLAKKVPSIESVKYLLNRYKKIYLIIGADNLESLPKWTKYEELKALVTFVVATRDNIEVPKSFLTLKVEEEISSSKLRANIDELQLPSVCSDEIIKFYKENN